MNTKQDNDHMKAGIILFLFQQENPSSLDEITTFLNKHTITDPQLSRKEVDQLLIELMDEQVITMVLTWTDEGYLLNHGIKFRLTLELLKDIKNLLKTEEQQEK